MRQATGDLLAFVDSDDTVPPRAYQQLVRSLRQSGSDFAVGSFKRDEGGRLRTRQWARRVHAERRLGTTVDEVPEILANVFAWTKMFVASSSNGPVCAFPRVSATRTRCR